MAPRSVTLDEWISMVGQEVGVSDWFLIDQDRIDKFADVTEDHQFLHIDPEAAAATPFGGTIAHGFLTLSMLSAMAYSGLPAMIGTTMGLNYGLNSLRFLAPVRSGKRVRGRFTLKDVTERAPGQWQSTTSLLIEIEGEAKPALVAEWVTLTFVG
jgi:acyl dehydratase